MEMLQNSKKIIVIGSTNTDMVIKSERLPVPGETVIGGPFLMNPGGKGANQAIAAARMGGNVTFVGIVGNDMLGRSAVRNLENEQIDISQVMMDPDVSSGVAQIVVDSNGENCIVVAPGANMTLNAENIIGKEALIRDAGMILMQLEIPLSTVLYVAGIAHKYGVKVILNPAPVSVLPDDLLASLYMITPNEIETEMLTGIRVTDEPTAACAAGILKDKGVEIVVITLGNKGAYIFSDGLKKVISVDQVKAVDSTAAGDTFNGALAVALLRGEELEQSIRYANKAASISVTRMGAQASIPFKNEVFI